MLARDTLPRMVRPSMADTPHEVEAILNSLPGRFRPERVTDWSGVFHWEIRGAERPEWTVRIDAGGCEIQEGHAGQPDCTIRMGHKTFVAIETGKRNPMVAFVKGKIKITNVGNMRRYDRAFYKFHDVPESSA